MLGLIEIAGVSIDAVHRLLDQSGYSKSAQRISEPMHKYGRTRRSQPARTYRERLLPRT